MIQRYDVNSCSDDCDPVTLMKDGDYILYADHLAVKKAALKEKDKIIEKMRIDRRKGFERFDEQIAALTAQRDRLKRFWDTYARTVDKLAFEAHEEALEGADDEEIVSLKESFRISSQLNEGLEEQIAVLKDAKNKNRELDEESEWT